MQSDFKTISIYIDKHYTLYGVPTTRDKKLGAIVDTNSVKILNNPYSENDVENFINFLFELCNKTLLETIPKLSGLPNYLGVKSYTQAIRDKKMVLITKDDCHYIIIPSLRKESPTTHFTLQNDQARKVRINYPSGHLAKEFMNILKKYFPD